MNNSATSSCHLRNNCLKSKFSPLLEAEADLLALAPVPLTLHAQPALLIVAQFAAQDAMVAMDTRLASFSSW